MRIDLERAIERLADNQRLVLVLFDIEGFTHQDTARQLGIAVGTSKATLSRARTILRSILTALPFLRSARLRSMSVTNLRDGTERTYINSAN